MYNIISSTTVEVCIENIYFILFEYIILTLIICEHYFDIIIY